MRTPLSNNLTYHEANLHKSLSRLYFSSHLNWWSISSILLDRLKNLLLRFYPTTALIGKTQHCKHFYCHFLWRCKWAIWSLRDFFLRSETNLPICLEQLNKNIEVRIHSFYMASTVAFQETRLFGIFLSKLDIFTWHKNNLKSPFLHNISLKSMCMW